MRDVEADAGHAFDHCRRRCSARDHAAHLLRDALAQRCRCADDEAVHDRCGAIVVDLVFAHRAQNRCRIDPSQAHMRAAQHRHGPGETPAVAVEHRQGPQVARKVRHRPGGRIAHGVQIGAAVVGDHALRVARGARRVAHRDRVPFVARAGQHRQRRMRGQQGLVVMRPDALARAVVFGVRHVDHHQARGHARCAASAAPVPSRAKIHDR